MSLEERLAALQAAVEENTATLKAGLKMSGAAPKPAAAAASPKPAAAKPAAAKSKVPTNEDVKEVFSGYLAAKGAAKETAKANVRAILAHYGVEKASEIPEENRAEALSYVEQFKRGETPNFMNESEGGEGEDDGLL